MAGDAALARPAVFGRGKAGSFTSPVAAVVAAERMRAAALRRPDAGATSSDDAVRVGIAKFSTAVAGRAASKAAAMRSISLPASAWLNRAHSSCSRRTRKPAMPAGSAVAASPSGRPAAAKEGVADRACASAVFTVFS